MGHHGTASTPPRLPPKPTLTTGASTSPATTEAMPPSYPVTTSTTSAARTASRFCTILQPGKEQHRVGAASKHGSRSHSRSWGWSGHQRSTAPARHEGSQASPPKLHFDALQISRVCDDNCSLNSEAGASCAVPHARFLPGPHVSSTPSQLQLCFTATQPRQNTPASRAWCSCSGPQAQALRP